MLCATTIGEIVKGGPERRTEPWWETASLLGAPSLVRVQELQGSAPHTAAREGCPVGRPSQPEARKIRVSLESKWQREQMLFGESGEGFSGSAACWWVPF